MGREIRRVPPDWEHRKYTKNDKYFYHNEGSYHPLYDNDYETACREWYAKAAEFKPSKYSNWYHEYAGNPPDEEYYRSRKWTPEEATWYQMYETVSEGTPVTPAFATKQELVEYLVSYGDYWNQKDKDGGWDRRAAERFVESEWAPSMIVMHTPEATTVQMPRHMKGL